MWDPLIKKVRWVRFSSVFIFDRGICERNNNMHKTQSLNYLNVVGIKSVTIKNTELIRTVTNSVEFVIRKNIFIDKLSIQKVYDSALIKSISFSPCILFISLFPKISCIECIASSGLEAPENNMYIEAG